MNTHLYKFLADYESSGMLRAHMPGHKGKSPAEELPDSLYAFDITEIDGADSLYEADGIIAISERYMSLLYGSAATVYSAGGSTLCIQTMLALMKQENRRVFAVRNVHRAFLNAAALLGIEPEWILPRYEGGILSGEINLKEVKKALAGCSEPACLYVTSPDYTGKLADIRSLAEICHKYGARLLVDNAHGAHLAFLKKNLHPIALGADLCCDSAHKMLPALTGAAMLHTSDSRLSPKLLRQTMSLFGSTSPSYLIMLSLDMCIKYIDSHITENTELNLRWLDKFRGLFEDRLVFADSEPFHITINCAESGCDGIELAELLRRNGVECEYADRALLVLLMSPVNVQEDYIFLSAALKKSLDSAKAAEPVCCPFMRTLPVKAMSIRDAVFSPSEDIPVEAAPGRICGAVSVPCPPAVPIAASGEIINRECIDIFRSYGITHVNVVKEK